MARIRTIKPEFWVDEVMVELPFETRLLFIGLWNFVDDHGYIQDKPKRIKMMVFPADNILIEDSLNALCDSGRLQRFVSDQGPLLQIVNWERHQKVNRPSPTRFTGITPESGGNKPKPRKDSLNTHGGFSEPSVLKGKERKGKDIDTTYLSSSDSADAEPDPNILSVLEAIDQHCLSHGFKKPNRTKANHTAARLLLTTDGYTLDQVLWIINWVSKSGFWEPHIRSATKLREKFEQLKAQATSNQPSRTQTGSGFSHARNPAQDALDIARQFYEAENPHTGLEITS